MCNLMCNNQVPRNKTITAEYNGYTGCAYGVSSFSVKDEEGREIFHTGFLSKRPANKAECLRELKDTLELIGILKNSNSGG